MKHCILVKWNEQIKKEDYKKMEEEVKEVFLPLLEIEGIKNVKVLTNCIDRDNRYNLEIRIEMSKEALEVYDNSIYHHKWKEQYSSYILKKAIFDYEDEID